MRTVFGSIYELRFFAIWHLFFWKMTNDKRLSVQFSFRLHIGDALIDSADRPRVAGSISECRSVQIHPLLPCQLSISLFILK